LLRGKAPCLFDVRASGEAFQCFCVPRDNPEMMHVYSKSIQPMDEIPPQGCSARAAMAAGALCAMFKHWAMRTRCGLWHSRFDFSVHTFDVLHCEIHPKA
jgi:hypothetical protein